MKDINSLFLKVEISLMLKLLSLRKFGQKISPITPSATRLLINGQLVNSSSGETLTTYNPATGDKICDV